MNKTRNYKIGFSLVEVMLLFLAMSVVLAATMPILSHKTRAIPTKIPHGIYRCIPNANGTYTEEWYSSSRLIKSENNKDACEFNVPQANMYTVDLYGAGAGGINAMNLTFTNVGGAGGVTNTASFNVAGPQLITNTMNTLALFYGNGQLGFGDYLQTSGQNTVFRQKLNEAYPADTNAFKTPAVKAARLEFDRMLYQLLRGTYVVMVPFNYYRRVLYNHSSNVKLTFKPANSYRCKNPFATSASLVEQENTDASNIGTFHDNYNKLYRYINPMYGKPNSSRPTGATFYYVRTKVIGDTGTGPYATISTDDEIKKYQKNRKLLYNDMVKKYKETNGASDTVMNKCKYDIYHDAPYGGASYNECKRQYNYILTFINNYENSTTTDFHGIYINHRYYFQKKYEPQNSTGYKNDSGYPFLLNMRTDSNGNVLLNQARAYDGFDCLKWGKDAYFNYNAITSSNRKKGPGSNYYYTYYMDEFNTMMKGDRSISNLIKSPIFALAAMNYVDIIKDGSNYYAVRAEAKDSSGKGTGVSSPMRTSMWTDLAENTTYKINVYKSYEIKNTNISNSDTIYYTGKDLRLALQNLTYLKDASTAIENPLGGSSMTPFMKIEIRLKDNISDSDFTTMSNKLGLVNVLRQLNSIRPSGIYHDVSSRVCSNPYEGSVLDFNDHGNSHNNHHYALEGGGTHKITYESYGDFQGTNLANGYKIYGYPAYGMAQRTVLPDLIALSTGSKESFLAGLDARYGGTAWSRRSLYELYADRWYGLEDYAKLSDGANVFCFDFPKSNGTIQHVTNMTKAPTYARPFILYVKALQRVSDTETDPQKKAESEFAKKFSAGSNDIVQITPYGLDTNGEYTVKYDKSTKDTLIARHRAENATISNEDWTYGNNKYFEIRLRMSYNGEKKFASGDPIFDSKNETLRPYIRISEQSLTRNRTYTIGKGSTNGDHYHNRFTSLGKKCTFNVSKGGDPVEYPAGGTQEQINSAESTMRANEADLATTMTCFDENDNPIFGEPIRVNGGRYGESELYDTITSEGFTTSNRNCTNRYFCTMDVTALADGYDSFVLGFVSGVSVNHPSRTKFMRRVQGMRELSDLNVSNGGRGGTIIDRCAARVDDVVGTYETYYMYRHSYSNTQYDNRGRSLRALINNQLKTEIPAAGIDTRWGGELELKDAYKVTTGANGNGGAECYNGGVFDITQRINGVDRYSYDPPATAGGPGAVVISW